MTPTDDAYDPLDDVPKASHFSKKEAKVIGIAIFVMALLTAPVYLSCRGQSYKHVCKQNILGMSKAMNLYASANNDLLPPVYFADNEGKAVADKNGRAFTWASLASEYLGERSDFECPAASPEENSQVQHRTDSDKYISLSYGMYLPRGAVSLSSFRNAATAVLLTETSSSGASNTFNPLPIGSTGTGKAYDGFAIGWDTPTLTMETKWVTRLAFQNTAGGNFQADRKPRHEGGNWFLFADGHAATNLAPSARVQLMGAQAEGFWSNR